MNILEELKRRNVIRVGIAYIVGAWLLAQAADLVFDVLGAPDIVLRSLVAVLALGFVPAVIFAWAFELTPEGIRRESEVQRNQSITGHTAKKLDYATMAMLLGVVLFILADRFLLEPRVTTPALATGQAAIPVPANTEPTVEPNSVAVLPFADLSPEGNQEYFSDGIAEELLNLLVRVDGLQVASRTSSFAYKGSTKNIPAIASELKVANILEGSVRKAGNKVRITAQLIDTRNDRHLWSETFDRDLDDIFAIQDEIATAIVTALKEELGVETATNSIEVERVTENLDAYQLYLKGRGLFIAREDIGQAIQLFEQAIELDPGFARAWEGLAAAERVGNDWLLGDGIDHDPRALTAANKALELDPELSMPYAVLGGLRHTAIGGTLPVDLVESERLLSTAIEKDPKNSTAWLWRGLLYSHIGYFDKALADLDACLQIDPAYLNCVQHRGRVLLHMGDTEAALEVLAKTAFANFHSVDEVFVSTLVQQGNSLAAAYLASIVFEKYAPYGPAGDWVRALENPDEDHTESLARMQRWADKNSIDHVQAVPQVLAVMGDYEAANRSGTMQFVIWDPSLATYRQSAWFKEFADTSGLEAYWRANGFPPMCRSLGADNFECD